MTDEKQSTGAGAEPVSDYRERPKGVFSQNAQRWLFLGISAAVVLTVVLFGPEPPESTQEDEVVDNGAETDAPTEDEEVDERLAELERQIQESMRAIPQPSPLNPRHETLADFEALDLSDVDGAELPDELSDRMRELEFTSLFASNLAHTYRDDERYGQGSPVLGSAAPGLIPPEELYPPYTFRRPPSLAPPPVTGAEPGVLPPSPESRTPEGPAAPEAAAGPAQLAPEQAPRSRPTSRLYRLFEGNVIETALVNRLDSSFAGPIITMVTTDVYSHDRQRVLIPAGTKCIGRTTPVESLGQSRMAVSFHRLIMPDGYSVSLDQFEGLNQSGDTGLKDKVNHHYFQIFGVSIALGFLGAISQRELEEPFNSAGPQFARSAAQILDRFLNILPTVTIREGHRVKVYLTQDLRLPAYDAHSPPEV